MFFRGDYLHFCLLIRKEIKDIHQSAGRSFIDLCIFTFRAGYCGKFFTLHIEKFGKCTASCLELIHFVLRIIAFWTFPFSCHFHTFNFKSPISKITNSPGRGEATWAEEVFKAVSLPL